MSAGSGPSPLLGRSLNSMRLSPAGLDAISHCPWTHGIHAAMQNIFVEQFPLVFLSQIEHVNWGLYVELHLPWI
jgi:hypothetical protein